VFVMVEGRRVHAFFVNFTQNQRDNVLKSQIDYDNCPMCYFKSLNNNSNSSPRDMVLAVVINRVNNIFPWVRSLRTTGCKAKVVLLFDSVSYSHLSEDTHGLFVNCSISYFNVGYIPNVHYNAIFAIKNMLGYDFLTHVCENFDRVLFVDLYDVVFQEDPFNSNIGLKEMIITRETPPFSRSYNNQQRVLPLFNSTQYMNVLFKPVLNAGLVYSDPHSLIRYWEMYFSMFNPNDLNSLKTCDQGYMNYLYYSGRMEMAGIRVRVFYRKHGFDTLSSAGLNPNDLKIGTAVFKSTNTRLIIIHQFDRMRLCIDDLIQKCPQGNYMVKEGSYTRIW